MASQFLIINIHLCEEVEQDKFKKVLDKALDWVQCLPNSYIVKTTSDPDKWYVRLRQALGTENQFFVSVVDLTQRQGWLADWVWDWIMKNEPNVKQPDNPQRQTEQERAARPEEMVARI